MMMRIMNNHSKVCSINEPHFFEKMWTPSDEGRAIDQTMTRSILNKLFTGQRAGFFEDVRDHKDEYKKEVDAILQGFEGPFTRLGAYTAFLHYESAAEGKSIPCEKTPQNVFYIEEILNHFPEARIINMIRDPRGVMLSQKKKWKRKYLGATFITRREMMRLRVNYHPITIAKLWNAALSSSNRFKDNPRILNVKFESLAQEPIGTMEKVCTFLGIAFEKEMLLIPHAGSSTQADESEHLGIRKPQKRSWTEKGLSRTEVYICETICAEFMNQYGYSSSAPKPNLLMLIWHFMIFPFKLVLALLVNFGRMRSLADTLKRRLSSKR